MSRDLSRFLITVLRHDPAALELKPDKAGYVFVEDVLHALKRISGVSLTREQFERYTKNERFGYDETRRKIRADYGSSIGLKLADMYAPETPPEYLFHGSSMAALESIKRGGIQCVLLANRRPRDHVFLTESCTVALDKGSRHGRPVVIPVKAREMNLAGYLFYHAKNDIWLTDVVPPEFIDCTYLMFG